MRLSLAAATLFGVLAMESAAAQGTARARVAGTVAESENGAPIPEAMRDPTAFERANYINMLKGYHVGRT